MEVQLAFFFGSGNDDESLPLFAAASLSVRDSDAGLQLSGFVCSGEVSNFRPAPPPIVTESGLLSPSLPTASRSGSSVGAAASMVEPSWYGDDDGTSLTAAIRHSSSQLLHRRSIAPRSEICGYKAATMKLLVAIEN